MDENNSNPGQQPIYPSQPSFQQTQYQQPVYPSQPPFQQTQYQQPQYQQTQYQQTQNEPQYQLVLKTDRSIVKYILLSLVTFGIYGLVMTANMTDDINTVCSKYDNRNTINFWLVALVFTPLTCGIAYFVWMHILCNRIGLELSRRGICEYIGSDTFWLWNVLGGFIFVGPFIFMYKFINCVNLLNADFNEKG